MTTRRALDDVISDYRAAHTKAAQLAHFLEGIPIYTQLDRMDQEFARNATRLTEQATALTAEIHRMAQRVKEVTPDD
jgi:hypothetical protein